MSSIIRFRFVRGEEVKYISHLDLMKVFERALRRARLPIAYSQGFNPHPQMVFGLPLSVGVTSEAEYADFEMSEEITPEEFMKTLNGQLPEGLRITEARIKNIKTNIMASIVLSSYDIFVYTDSVYTENGLEKCIEDFLKRPEIIAKKEGKSGSRDIDIKPMIRQVTLRKQGIDEEKKFLSLQGYEPERIFCISALLAAGSSANLKPELLVSALIGVAGLELRSLRIHRTALFTGLGGDAVSPLDDRALSG